MKRAGSDDGSTPHTGLVPTDETHQRHVDDARVKSATHLETSAGETAPATSAAVRHDDAASTEHAATRANGTAPAGPAAAGSARHATDARGAISSSRATGNRTNVASEQACNAASRAAARYTRLKKLPSRAGSNPMHRTPPRRTSRAPPARGPESPPTPPLPRCGHRASQASRA